MSDQKITAKNLSYDTSLPPFLARLHAQAAGSSDSPDSILSAHRRPRGPGRSASEEAEDAPLVLDEQGNAVAIQVDDDGVVLGNADSSETTQTTGLIETGNAEAARDDEKSKRRSIIASATFGTLGRKRKVAKVVGDGDYEGLELGHSEGVKDKKPGSTETDSGSSKTAAGDATATATTTKVKKPKKMKLSFDDEQ